MASEQRQRKAPAASAAASRPVPAASRRPRTQPPRNVNAWAFIAPVLLFWIAMAFALSYIVTETLTFGLTIPSYRKIMTQLFPATRNFTLEELKQYDGTDPAKPIYLAILGKVYDVSNGRGYYAKPNGSYSMFAGTDAGRAFVTGCFETHLTHDLRGLTDAEIDSIKGWQQFYDNADNYYFVGRIHYPPIDPDSPIPEPCNKGEKNEKDKES
ncbi:hypothetical protein SeMB42_g04391 [Synchytrium endobioticum]|uniref:Cytochrome b5 heme-binding domain-containing protein n=1 Tax=Synchytrium endobioticum TaxID=286115 RepID=A0A507DFU3_9FUNG|nr:hypothetical protein SeMB42_g04391 [Synchytrium endobioticum]TPX50215.1 hypothetical protein SeLEV6574_g01059 [Synchytrium endobioticum]